MIKNEPFMINNENTELVRTYSDDGYMIKQIDTGILYVEAIDPVDCNRAYEETDILIETENDNETDNIE